MYYHWRSRELLRVDSDRRVDPRLDETEVRLGMPLPDALRELYELPELLTIVDDPTGDHLLAPENLKLSRDDDSPILVFMYETQGVLKWGCRFDGNTDSEVLVAWNAEEEKPWTHCSESISVFIYTQVFDWQFWRGNREYGREYVGEIQAPLTKDDLDFLKTQFDEEPATFGGFYTTIYRFSAGWGQRVLIGNVDKQQSDWSISADTEADMQHLRAKLAPHWTFPYE